MRVAACFGAALEVVEPCAFPLTARGVKKAAMDYGGVADVVRHPSLDAFLTQTRHDRLVLFTTKGAIDHWDIAFEPGDVLVFGRESAGAPPEVHARADLRARIPIAPGARSLNLVTAVAVGLAEAARQTAQG